MISTALFPIGLRWTEVGSIEEATSVNSTSEMPRATVNARRSFTTARFSLYTVTATSRPATVAVVTPAGAEILGGAAVADPTCAARMHASAPIPCISSQHLQIPFELLLGHAQGF